MNNIHKKRQYMKMIQYFKARNKLSAFPLIDTGYIKALQKLVDKDDVDYDMDPVVCCTHCKKLCIKIDDDNNDICVLCSNSINETETYSTIFHYLNKYPERWS